MADLPEFEINYEQMWEELEATFQDMATPITPETALQTMKIVRDLHIRRNNAGIVEALADFATKKNE